LTQLNEDSGNTPEEAKKRMEAVLPPSVEFHRYESNAEYYGVVASGGRAFDWLKQQLKAEAKVAGRNEGPGAERDTESRVK
jgi:hypothetical protein